MGNLWIEETLRQVRTDSTLLAIKLPLRETLYTYGVTHNPFEGAVIDLETDEQNFLDDQCGAARYRNHTAVCCSILDKDEVQIIARTRSAPAELFSQSVDERLKKVSRPYYAFNAGCDMALLSSLLSRDIPFDRELQQCEYQNKGRLRREFGIPDFSDPFTDNGLLAAREWTNHCDTGNVECVKRIIAHNLACVLKEYCILMRSGYREIAPSSHKKFLEGKGELVFGIFQNSLKS
ncbi:hypothetical protein COS86_07170 [Candidatus Bathyarchaeota archaeon CG07_land_8_20_14_0_80_47_9]|nr:MAG: hypothetical protein COS86_07170 [Candidatus Bathyarchaeota archaeon CG07_land_8_20_14_0_80_47_9]